MDKSLLLRVSLLIVIANVVWCMNSPPTLRSEKDWQVYETDEVGHPVTTLIAIDSENDPVVFSLEGRPEGQDIHNYFEIDKNNRVRVAKKLTGLAGDDSADYFLGVRTSDGTSSLITVVRVLIMKNSSIPPRTGIGGRGPLLPGGGGGRLPFLGGPSIPGSPHALPPGFPGGSNQGFLGHPFQPPIGVSNSFPSNPQPSPGPPFITVKNKTWNVPADVTMGHVVAHANVVGVGGIDYNVTVEGSRDLFEVDADGAIRVAKPLDSEVGNYNLRVLATNAYGSMGVSVYLTISPPKSSPTTTTSYSTTKLSKDPKWTLGPSKDVKKSDGGGHGSQDLRVLGGNSIAGNSIDPQESTEDKDSNLSLTVIPIVVIAGISPLALALYCYWRRLKRRKARAEAKESAVIYCEKGDEAVGPQVPPRPNIPENGQSQVIISRLGWADRLLRKAQSNKYEEPIKFGGKFNEKLRKKSSPIQDNWEFPRHRLKFIGILGEGCFGQVWKCEAVGMDPKGPMLVAVKTLKESAGERERRDLIQELKVLKNLGKHINVVSLLGCCSEKDPIFIILEYMTGGKLQSYLRASRADTSYNNLHGSSSSLTPKDLTMFAYQIARGMEFLTRNGIIHRDLAARNILVGEEKVCKVADFGFARDIANNHLYSRKSDGRLPIRWMAPESLFDNIFTSKSDVWSFGVLLWEIVTLGSTPYPGLGAAEVMKKVKDNYRLEKPDHCRREIYNIMYYCWDKDPNERPCFTELVHTLENLLLSEVDYIELDRFPDHSYYNVVHEKSDELL